MRNSYIIQGMLWLALAWTGIAHARPMIGIQYNTWFDYDQQSNPCNGKGWAQNPFGLPDVQALTMGPPQCYSSMAPLTATNHAKYFDELGIDFVIIDDTNLSKGTWPNDDLIYQGALQAIAGFKKYTHKTIRVTFQLSLTCYAEQCFGRKGDQREISVWNGDPSRENVNPNSSTQPWQYAKAAVEDIASQVLKDPARWLYWQGKPLLTFYVNAGSNVRNLDNSPAFGGPGNLIPASAWDPPITVNGTTTTLRRLFTVRFMIVANSNFDYRPYSAEIWPFQCNGTDCYFTEAGYAALYSPEWQNRSISQFNRLVGEASDKQALIIRTWNEFSSTDEKGGASYTIEPNTQLYKVDSTPGHADPWYFYNQIKWTLNQYHWYQLVNKNSGKCADVRGVSASDGAPVQQWQCLGTNNQYWYLIPYLPLPGTGLTNYYQVVSKNSLKCLEVIGASTDDGAVIQQYRCLEVAQYNQLWQFAPVDATYDQVKPESSGKCLDVVGVSTANGALTQQYRCLGAGQANQLWRLQQIH